MSLTNVEGFIYILSLLSLISLTLCLHIHIPYNRLFLLQYIFYKFLDKLFNYCILDFYVFQCV